ncbi:MAG: LuxR C-terminal-related transcriptional regulator [Planctomycetes bacterium]|nr:LuxR C-terminal-related transcriptional regulator [Planctomycetota bacterium]
MVNGWPDFGGRPPGRQRTGGGAGKAPVNEAEAPRVATPWAGLTRRESAVAELLTLGLSNPEICATLFVSENTIRTHIKNIYRKTGAASREELKTLLRETTGAMPAKEGKPFSA